MNPRLIGAWKLAGPWILYDGDCPLCLRGERVFGGTLRRRSFRLATLQSDIGRHFAPGPIVEMKVVKRDGQLLGGAAALVYISGSIWWAKPVSWLWNCGPGKPILERLYRFIAAHRGCVGTCNSRFPA